MNDKTDTTGNWLEAPKKITDLDLKIELILQALGFLIKSELDEFKNFNSKMSHNDLNRAEEILRRIEKNHPLVIQR